MHAELPVLSFICALFLTVLLPLKDLRTKIANFTIVLGLLLCNIIHGINNIVWAGNVDIHIPVWCDIVTNILRGAIVALLTACLCISYNLEFISSTRKISGDPHENKQRTIIELVLCISLPVVYTCIHSIVQDHRFDLVQDFGCSASIFPSAPSLIIIWFPPLILCSVSFVYSGLAIYNVHKRMAQSNFSAYLESRSLLTTSVFSHQLAMSIVTSIFVSVLVLVSIISTRVPSWTFSSAAHVQFAYIAVIHSPNNLRVIVFTWWTIPLLSLAHIMLSVAFGKEAGWLRNWFQTYIGHKSLHSASLPVHRKKSPDAFPRVHSPSAPQAQIVDLKSGWDEMLQSKTSRGFLPKIKTKSRFSYTLSTSPESSSAHSPSFPDEDTFMASTISYLGSPVAHTLGLTSPTTYVPPCAPPPPIRPPRPKDPSKTLSLVNIPQVVVQPIPEDACSIVSSLWDKPWPQPPTTIPSPNSPVGPADALHPFATPQVRTRALEGSGVSSGPQAPVVPKPVASKPPCTKDLRRARRDGNVKGYIPGEVIYMTTVRETV